MLIVVVPKLLTKLNAKWSLW